MSKYIIDTEDYLFDLKGVIGVGLDRNKQIVFRGTPIEEMEQLNASYVRKHFEDELESAFAHGLTKAESEYRDLLDKAKDEAYQRGYKDCETRYCSFDACPNRQAEYQRGLNDAWKAAKKLFSSMAESDIEKAFPIEWNNGGFNALINLQPQEVIKKLKAYEEKQDDKIEVGDTVDLKDAVSDKGGGIVTKIFNNDCCYIVWYDGSGGAWAKDMLVKTGKHIDIASILKEINDEP